jgi:hypothetical protein
MAKVTTEGNPAGTPAEQMRWVRFLLDAGTAHSESYRPRVYKILAKHIFGWEKFKRTAWQIVLVFDSITRGMSGEEILKKALDPQGRLIINHHATRRWLLSTEPGLSKAKALLKYPEAISPETRTREDFIAGLKQAIKPKKIRPVPKPSGSLTFAGPRAFRRMYGRKRGPSGGRRRPNRP